MGNNGVALREPLKSYTLSRILAELIHDESETRFWYM